MNLCRAALVAALVFATVPSLHADVAPMPSVRTGDAALRKLLEAGLAGSPSLRRLISRLDASDVIVHITNEDLPPGVDGRLTFTTVAGERRYLQVRLNRRMSDIRRLATLGHELQHALEVAGMPSVVDDESLAEGFARIGMRRPSRTHEVYETLEALAVGERVWRELSAMLPRDY